MSPPRSGHTKAAAPSQLSKGDGGKFSASSTPPAHLPNAHRRLFAQEFTTQLRRIGSASLGQMEHDFHLTLFKIPASSEELRQVSDVARRFGWVQRPDRPDDGEWSLTDAGSALNRPTSLATVLIVTRLFRAVNPVREQATSLLPYLALVAGGAAAFATDVTTLTVVRIIVISVLAWAFAVQLAGEAQIIRAIKAWPRLGDSDERVANRAVLRFYGWRRFGLNVGLLACTVAAFGFGIFEETTAFWIAAVGVFLLGVPVLVLSLLATREVRSRARQ
jgi:hypothetical protein